MNNKGLILINAYSELPHSLNQAYRLNEEFSKIGISTDIVRNDSFFLKIVDGKISMKTDIYDFCIYLDKDKYVSQMLEKSGVRLFNSHDSILACDDKMTTNILLANKGITIPKTLGGLLCYDFDKKVKSQTLEIIENTLGYPLIAKESYGSLGKGVYKVDNRAELEDVCEKLKLKPHLFQEFISSSYGKDIRIIVIENRVVAGMLRKSEGDFRSNLELGGTGEKIALSEEICALSVKIAEILNLDYCGIDWLIGEHGEPVLCEVNSNAFFGGIEQVTGINVAKAYVDHVRKVIYGK